MVTDDDIREYAEALYARGDENSDLGRGILDMLDTHCGDDFLELVSDLKDAAGEKFPDGEQWRYVEFLRDKSSLLDECKDILDQAGYSGDIDEALNNALTDLKEAEAELEVLRAELAELKKGRTTYLRSLKGNMQ